jgi:L-rhamnose mutarotase
MLKLKQSTIGEYVERHRAVWPEMRAALRETGWCNYSLFLGPGGSLIGYLETENFEAALSKLKEFPVNSRWQAEMAPFFEADHEHPDDNLHPLQEVFHCG